MEYYGVRNGKIDLKDLKIPFRRFWEFFLDTYYYFYNKNYFKLAFEGDRSTSRLMTPSPEVYIFNHVGNINVFPIEQYGEKLDKVTLFTLIEVLHQYIRKLDDFDMYDKETAQREFRDEINKFLIHLEEG